MTFLLFLVSLGLLQYILRQAGETASGSGPDSAEKRAAESLPAVAANAAGSAGLWALGQALEEQGRGKTPQPNVFPAPDEEVLKPISPSGP